MTENIVITGAGIVSAIGLGKEETLRSLLDERTGIAPLHYLHNGQQGLPAGEVKLTDEEMKQRLNIGHEPTTRTTLMGMMALEEALGEARLWDKATKLPMKDKEQRVALVSGTTVGGMDKSEQFYTDFVDNDSHNDYIRVHDCGSTTELIASHFSQPAATGPRGEAKRTATCPPVPPESLFSMLATPSTACSSAANAIIMGANLLRGGMADIAVVGGAECITRFHLNGFQSLMIIDQRQCRPFDANHTGLNLGEGAAYMVMETAGHALRRGACPIARLSGYGNACDAHHQTASSEDGQGAFIAMQKALRMACLRPQDIDYVNAHGTGTPNNDASESQALRRLFNEALPPISSTKGMTGHATSASGAIEAVICLLALRHSFLPANMGFTTPMEGGITPVMHTVDNHPLHHVLCNSFGFGGNDTSIILSETT